ncbi:hypothetical protein [Hugenholtzia roseola]|uniref:hypothetical protein n=1 Tax=Hugenholtzia roseola TaxID=1002 RepID=UPI0005501ED5|nr:hypothetical protein [Hugenholtzia roseola]
MKNKSHNLFILIPFLIFLLGLAAPILGNTPPLPLTWKALAKVSFRSELDNTLGYKVSRPIFEKSVEAYENQEVVIEGYIVPLEIGEKYFVISAYPFASCFFCGQAGIETVMEVYVNKPIRLDKETIKVKGKLKLNRKDANRLIYILEEAQEIR